MEIWSKIEWRIKFYAKKLKKSTPFQRIENKNRTALLAMKVNSYLSDYKNMYQGKDIYIVGCGPSEKHFDDVNSDGIYIGINRAFKDERIEFDYLFAQDTFPEGMDEFAAYRPHTCKKMLAWVTGDDDILIRQTEASKMDCSRYILDCFQMGTMPYDISLQPFADLRGTVFSALQFALYTNPKRIYLVGFDCSQGNCFSKQKSTYSYQLKSWLVFKRYVDKFWRNTEIISINPVGLKGVFKDEITESFMRLEEE